MEILSYQPKIVGRGNSKALDVSAFTQKKMTVLLSSITGGTAVVQYSCDTPASVVADTAIWHEWSVGALTSSGGIVFDGPTNYLRVIVSVDAVSYIFEALV